jgi:hypothetical protein
MWMQNTGYRFWVGEKWGVTGLGILAVGLGVAAQLTSIIESLAMQFLYPYFARKISDAKSEEQTALALADMLNVLAPIYAIWAGFNAMCAAALLEILTDARYHVAVPFLIFGAMIEFMRCTTNLWSNTARSVLRTKGLILPYGLGALIVWLGVIGSAHFGAGLTAVSTVLLIAGMITCVSMIVIMQRMLRISVDTLRMAIGLGVMTACFSVAVVEPVTVAGRYQSLALLLSGGIIASVLMVAMLWKNPALLRMLSTPLKKE